MKSVPIVYQSGGFNLYTIICKNWIFIFLKIDNVTPIVNNIKVFSIIYVDMALNMMMWHFYLFHNILFTVLNYKAQKFNYSMSHNILSINPRNLFVFFICFFSNSI